MFYFCRIIPPTPEQIKRSETIPYFFGDFRKIMNSLLALRMKSCYNIVNFYE